jgi:UrcA family protein
MKTSTRARLVSAPGHVCKILIAGGSMALATYYARAAIAEENPPQVTVRYNDLNLTSASGAATLKRRIQRAAEAVCGDLSFRELQLSMQYRECVNDAADRALVQVHWGK